jgi:flagellar assembly protein FliH
LSRRIIGSNVQLGDSRVVGQPLKQTAGSFDEPLLSKEELYQQLKEKEFKDKLDRMMHEAKQQADAIIEDAKLKGVQILDEAAEKIRLQEDQLAIHSNQVFEDARQEGFQQGYEEGKGQAYSDVLNTIANLEAVADSAYKIKKEIILSSEQEILELSRVIAERVLRQQLQIKPEFIIEVIRAAINELKDKEEIKIIVNPSLKEQMYNFSEELKQTIKGMKVIKIVEDKTIHANSAIIESPESRIDARLEAQVAEVFAQLMQSFEEEPVLAEIIEQEPVPEVKAVSKKKKAT